MSGNLYLDLGWLPSAPPTFAASCKALATEAAPGPAIRALANHALDEAQLARLGRAIMRAQSKGRR